MGFDPSLFSPEIQRKAGYSPRVIGGRTAHQTGKEFEKLILASHTDDRGTFVRLVAIKNFAKRIPMRDPADPTGKPRMQLIEEKSPFDCCGTVIGTGRGIFLDAKSCGDDLASLAVNNPSVVKPHQINILEDLERGGAIAGFLVRCCRDGVYLWLPGSKARRAKPIRWDDSAFIEIGPIRMGYGVPLRALIEYMERK